MSEPEGSTTQERSDPAAGEASFLTIRESLRGIAHDLNGALNTLALNVELLDRSTASRVGSEEDELARARCLARLRRAIGEIQEIVEQRLNPLGRQDGTDASS